MGRKVIAAILVLALTSSANSWASEKEYSTPEGKPLTPREYADLADAEAEFLRNQTEQLEKQKEEMEEQLKKQKEALEDQQFTSGLYRTSNTLLKRNAEEQEKAWQKAYAENAPTGHLVFLGIGSQINLDRQGHNVLFGGSWFPLGWRPSSNVSLWLGTNQYGAPGQIYTWRNFDWRAEGSAAIKFDLGQYLASVTSAGTGAFLTRTPDVDPQNPTTLSGSWSISERILGRLQVARTVNLMAGVDAQFVGKFDAKQPWRQLNIGFTFGVETGATNW
jgi:hypothetical protein